MNFFRPKFKTATIITVIIFIQKIYRHPAEFSFIFDENLTLTIFGILGVIALFGSVFAFVYLVLAFLKEIIKKIKDRNT